MSQAKNYAADQAKNYAAVIFAIVRNLFNLSYE